MSQSHVYAYLVERCRAGRWDPPYCLDGASREYLRSVEPEYRAAACRAAYSPSECIGYGASSIVYRCGTDGEVVKVLHEAHYHPEEILCGMGLAHRHVVAMSRWTYMRPFYIFAFDSPAGTMDLQQAIAGSSPEIPRVLFRQVACALAYLHSRGVAHCDVKPENVIVDASMLTCRLGDFGAAVVSDDLGVRAVPNLHGCVRGAVSKIPSSPCTPNERMRQYLRHIYSSDVGSKKVYPAATAASVPPNPYLFDRTVDADERAFATGIVARTHEKDGFCLSCARADCPHKEAALASRLESRAVCTKTAVVRTLCTMAYVAPEVHMWGAARCNLHAADAYSFGSMILGATTGGSPYSNEALRGAATPKTLGISGFADLSRYPHLRARYMAAVSLDRTRTLATDNSLEPALVSLLTGLLDPDPERRLTMARAAQHEFFGVTPAAPFRGRHSI